MRKSFITIFAFLVLICTNNFVLADTVNKMAVFPVTVKTTGSYGIYPDTSSLVANDVINKLTKDKVVSVLDIQSSQDQIKSLNVEKQYNRFLFDYKSTYTLDYNLCSLIASKLGVNKILLVSGGFDLQNQILKRNLLYTLCVPSSNPIKSSYRLNIFLSLIDTQSGVVEWENTYKKDIDSGNFSAPSQYFGEDVVPIEKIKEFSRQISVDASKKIAEILSTGTTDVQSTVVPSSDSKTKEGTMTTDGHFYSSSDGNYVLNNRKNNYKNWIKRYLP